MDEYLTLLNQALTNRQSIWMFYTIIVTTAIGTAFSDNYKNLNVVARIFLTWAVGAAVWYNFYAAIVNAEYIAEIVKLIREELDPENGLGRLFFHKQFHAADSNMLSAIFYIYLPINVAVFVAMWWDELSKLYAYVRAKV